MEPIQNQGRARRLPLHQIELVLEEFRKLKGGMMPLEMLTLLHVAQHEGCAQGEVGDVLGVSPAGICRAMSALGDEKYGSNGVIKSGLDLVTFRPLDENRRLKRCYLTAKGKSVIRSLESYLD